jgi:AMP-polyphosphate phosphotransferase
MTIRLSRLDMVARVRDKAAYERELEALQLKLLSIQQAYFHVGRRGIVVVEGWDAAGKGGLIRRLTERLDPRGIKVWPIGPPAASEQGRHYLYRFWTRLPEPGTLAVFDRSWYGRVLVERVNGLIDRAAWQRAYREINAFEAMLTDDGVRLVKLFLHITPEEQIERFAERLNSPYKRWKLTEADLHAHLNWDAYVEAAEAMFARTSTKAAPWTVIAANQKWVARLRGLSVIAATLGRGIDLRPPAVDAKLRRAALRLLGQANKGKKK